MQSIPAEILGEILLRLSTKGVARSCCVCRLWRSIVADPSFRAQQGNARHVVSTSSGAEAETLLCVRGRAIDLEMTVLGVSTAKPICRFTDLTAGYSLVNACNGFLLMASHVKDWPLYVCNPATGEKLEIPAPPEIKQIHWRTYAMGYSPSTREYKLFRLSFANQAWPEIWANHLDVYTLGGGDEWHRRPSQFPHCVAYTPPPVLIDGKLYLLMGRSRAADRILVVIDVASEAQRTYSLPEEFVDDEEATAAHAFELRGRLCVATRSGQWPRVRFWVMPSLPMRRLCDDSNDTRLPEWELRYTFYLDVRNGDYGNQLPCSVWLDKGNRILCYRLGDFVYEYDTTKRRQRHKHFLEWNYQHQLRLNPFALSADMQWNVYGGYLPSLLSPASVSLLQRHRDEQEGCEQALGRVW